MLAPRLQRLPVLLIATYRPEYSPKCAEQAHATLLSLTRLGRRQAAELVFKITDDKVLPAEVLEQIVAHTDGIPLFIEELTKSILESKLLHEDADRYTLHGPLPTLAIPTTLRDSLIARLDRLAPIREVAQIGACIGRDFSYQLLAAVSAFERNKLDEALEQLTKSGLIFRRGTPPDATYTFKHALVQDTAYDSLLKSKRSQLHARIAEVLESHFSEIAQNSPEVLARHCAAAGIPAKAVTYWHKAGERAVRHSAHKEAISHLNKAIETLATLPENINRDQIELSLQIDLGSPLTAIKGYAAPELGTAFARARVLCTRLGNESQAFKVLRMLWLFYMVRARTYAHNTRPMTIAGIPGISLPIGMTAKGLPVGLEFDAPYAEDRSLLSLALAMEQLFGKLKAPPI